VLIVSSFPTWLSPWEWLSSDWAGLTFLVIVGAAYVAWRQVKEAQRLREEQARPFVVIDFEPWNPILDLRIRNFGTTLARGVKFEFTPPLSTTHDDMPERGNLMELDLFKNGIQSLPPAKEITVFFDHLGSHKEHGLPMKYGVQVTYTGPGDKHYSEPMDLNLTMYLGTGGVTRHDFHDIHRVLEEIAGAVKRWTDHEGLKVLTQGDMKRRREHRAAVRAAPEAGAPSTPQD
jgi:hypothetical protein